MMLLRYKIFIKSDQIFNKRTKNRDKLIKLHLTNMHLRIKLKLRIKERGEYKQKVNKVNSSSIYRRAHFKNIE